MEIQINRNRLAMKLHIYIMIHVTSRTHSWRESNIFLHEFTVSPFIRVQFWLDYVFFSSGRDRISEQTAHDAVVTRMPKRTMAKTSHVIQK